MESKFYIEYETKCPGNTKNMERPHLKFSTDLQKFERRN